MKKNILLLLSLFSFGLLNAQLSLAPKAVPSPNTASLGLYGVIPVGHYTGTPQINIPLYEMELNGAKFPLSLSYHASGIKVSQDASWVGMGWTLNAGGCITSAVRGWADLETGMQRYDPPSYIDPENPATDPIGKDYQTYKNIEENKVDAEPDIFYFNFGKYSGSFFIPKGDDFNRGIYNITIQKPDCYLDIRRNNGQWVITDGDGFKYFFSEEEITRSRSRTMKEQNNRNLYGATSQTKITAVPARYVEPRTVSAWYLKTIVAPNGQTLTFTYGKEEIYTPLSMQETAYERISGNLATINITTYSFSEITTLVLKKITGPNLTIDFSTEPRYDIQPHIAYPKPTHLTEITISNNQSLLKKYEFDCFYTGKLNDYDNCRLFLNSVQEVGADGKKGGKYSFGYHEGTLPSKISTDIDYWGYYTKPSSNKSSRCWGRTIIEDNKYSTLIPPIDYSNDLVFYGQNRISDPERMCYGSLKWIKYPTGGKTTFKFEPHTLTKGGSYSLPVPLAQFNEGTFSFDEAYNGYETGEFRDDFPNGIKEGEPFEFKGSAIIALSMGFQYWADEPSLLEDFWSRKKYIAILNKYNNITGKYEIFRQVDFPMVSEDADDSEVHINLEAGKYRVDITRSFTFSELNEVVSFDILGYMDYTVSGVFGDPIGGGLCVKEIESIDLNGNIIKKSYDYDDGTLMSPIISHQLICVSMTIIEPNASGEDSYIPASGCYLCAFSDSYVPMSSSASGNFVGYNKVREFLTEEGLEKGYTEFSFYNDCDELIDSKFFLPSFPTTPRLSNGLIKRKADYNNQSQLVREELFDYEFIDGPVTQGVRAYRLPAMYGLSNYLYFKFYDIHSSWNRLRNKKISEYSINGSLIWQNTENFIYEPTNYQIKEIQTETSTSNTKLRKVMEYPVNLKKVAAPYQQMVEQHIVNPVVEERNYVIRGNNQSLLNTQRMTYDSFNGKLLPTSLQQNADKGSSVLETRIRITKYDKNGQPNEYIKDDTERTVYLWAYNSMYLVAKIEGTTYTNVESWLGTSFINTLSDNTTTVEANLATLRSKLADKNVLVTTYTYRPQVGMTSMTAPNGEVTRYEYDTLGRLANIKDYQGKVTEEYDYHYKP